MANRLLQQMLTDPSSDFKHELRVSFELYQIPVLQLSEVPDHFPVRDHRCFSELEIKGTG